MNKKLIRLTESDLHRIIKESVKTILKEIQLNELDPRTYASARDRQKELNKRYNKDVKLFKQGKLNNEPTKPKGYDTKRAEIFNQHAVDRYNDEYGFSRGFGGPYNKPYAYQMNQDGTTDFDVAINDNDFMRMKRFNDKRGSAIITTPKGHNFPDEEDFDEYNPKAYDVARQMKNKNGEYIKGKGWR